MPLPKLITLYFFLSFSWIAAFTSNVVAEVATVVFTNGQVLILDDTYAYARLAEAVKVKKGFVELGLKSGSFLINLDQVVTICREDCRKLIYKDPRS